MSLPRVGTSNIDPVRGLSPKKPTTAEPASPIVYENFSKNFPVLTTPKKNKQAVLAKYNSAVKDMREKTTFFSDIKDYSTQTPQKTNVSKMEQALLSLDRHIESHKDSLTEKDLNIIIQFREAVSDYIEVSSSWGKKKQTAATLSETSIFNKDVGGQLGEEEKTKIATLKQKMLEKAAQSPLKSKTFLGKGGFGKVYKVPLKGDGGSAIVKIPVKKLTEDDLADIEREADIGKAMGYATVVTNDGHMFQKCVGNKDGTGFVNNIKKNPGLFTFNREQAASMLEEKLKTQITKFHEKGYIHRDLKLDNIMIEYVKDDAGKIKDFNVNLIDFGITDQMWTGEFEKNDEGKVLFYADSGEFSDFETKKIDIWNNFVGMTTFKGTASMISEAYLRDRDDGVGIQEGKFDLKSIGKSKKLTEEQKKELNDRFFEGLEGNENKLQRARKTFIELWNKIFENGETEENSVKKFIKKIIWNKTEKNGKTEENVENLKLHVLSTQIYLQKLDMESIRAMCVQLRDGTPSM